MNCDIPCDLLCVVFVVQQTSFYLCMTTLHRITYMVRLHFFIFLPILGNDGIFFVLINYLFCVQNAIAKKIKQMDVSRIKTT